MGEDTVYRQAAIDTMCESCSDWCDEGVCKKVSAIQKLPSAESEQPYEIQDILNYLDTVLHPIISPEHWDVYSELHDMISMLPSSEPKLGKKDMPEQGDSTKFGVKTGKTCAYWDRESNICALHRPSAQPEQIARDIATIIENEKDMRVILKNAEPEQRWIPVTERLPVEGESVLLCNSYGDMTLGRLVRTNEGCNWDIYAWWCDIYDWVAWMPLPEPWKGDAK